MSIHQIATVTLTENLLIKEKLLTKLMIQYAR